MIHSAVLTQITGVTSNSDGPDSDGPGFDGSLYETAMCMANGQGHPRQKVPKFPDGGANVPRRACAPCSAAPGRPVSIILNRQLTCYIKYSSL